MAIRIPNVEGYVFVYICIHIYIYICFSCDTGGRCQPFRTFSSDLYNSLYVLIQTLLSLCLTDLLNINPGATLSFVNKAIVKHREAILKGPQRPVCQKELPV